MQSWTKVSSISADTFLSERKTTMERIFDTLVMCDFDGTVTTVDSMDALAKKYCRKDEWKKIASGLHRGTLNLFEAMNRELRCVKVSAEEFDDFILDSVDLTPGFEPFIERLSAARQDLLIISGGFTRTIRLVMKKFNIAPVKYYANELTFRGKTVHGEFPFFNEECRRCPTCKDMVFRGCHKLYDRIIVIGDGLSDCCVARRADIVFAKSLLAEFCESQNIRYTPFQNFHDIMQSLPEMRIIDE
jgi:2,3-diketo-5-methylthio-1-phosphopentane phosphatase